ncbi:hypothetical protein AA313_de0205569 [Arthrobotrys entomopaga]|nr:hypothetical protein AA313_de0205569 [Arthrobotrys entomopaga]
MLTLIELLAITNTTPFLLPLVIHIRISIYFLFILFILFTLTFVIIRIIILLVVIFIPIIYRTSSTFFHFSCSQACYPSACIVFSDHLRKLIIVDLYISRFIGTSIHLVEFIDFLFFWIYSTFDVNLGKIKGIDTDNTLAIRRGKEVFALFTG